MASMRTFTLERDEDETGVSGTGIVAWGAQFPDGIVVTRWCAASTEIRQTCVWESIEHVAAIHGHNGKTRIVWRSEYYTADP